MSAPRSEYVAGLRALADLLDATPDLPLPTTDHIEWAVHYFADEPDKIRAVTAKLARLIPGTLAKNDPESGDYAAKYFVLTGKIGGLPVEVWAERPMVCERVVTGTREVTEEVVAPDAPKMTVTRTVEDVAWVCAPLLAEATT